MSATQASSHEYDRGLSAYFNYYEYEIARESFFVAASRGHSGAQFYLGEIYEGGFAVEVDFKEALDWYLKAANNNHVGAQIRVANLLIEGRGVEPDTVLALHWYLKAANQGSPLAQFRLARLYSTIESESSWMYGIQAYKWWTLAASFGDPDALQARDLFANNITSDEITVAARLAADWEAVFNICGPGGIPSISSELSVI